MIDEKKLMDSVKSLRSAMGLNQVAFAARLGKSYPTVQRYENVAPPPPEELARMVMLAREIGRADLAQTFKIAAVNSVPEELRNLILEGDGSGQAPTKPVLRKRPRG